MNPSTDTSIPILGPCTFPSPLRSTTGDACGKARFVPDSARVRYQVEFNTLNDRPPEVVFEKAGPRDRIFFDPAQVRAAIVTCGGICPGLNNVIRSAFFELHHNYGVSDVLGIRYGYAGLNPAVGDLPILLTTQNVEHIHEVGGTILGSSRGPQPTEVLVDFLLAQGINLLVCVGGDGTLRGARDLSLEVIRRGLPIAVVGVPKTIDNDVMYVDRTFGVVTAVEKAREVLDGAHNEARSAFNGVGLVKVMGRDAGFIAAAATLASQEVNFTLIPEVPFQLEGEDGFLSALRRRLEARHHAVVVVAEGAGQSLIPDSSDTKDASGNIKRADVGIHLKDKINEYFQRHEVPVDVKYFDPSYLIRSVAANCEDAILCDQLARHAIHAGMAGKTNVVIGLMNGVFTHLPIPLVTSQKRHVDPSGALWNSVLATTGQPRSFE
ncbi:MAG: ATP-dependent 6-phosphofructokinase [Limisphaerales bacterium]